MSLSSEVVLKNIKADAVIVTDPYNIRYISGFRGGEATLYISENQRVLITDSRYTEAAKKESDFEVVEFNLNNKKTDILNSCIEKDAAKKVAYEDNAMLCRDFNILKSKLSAVEEFLPVAEALNDLRQIKSSEEIEYIRKAAAIADAAFDKILGFLKPGLTELEVACELEYYMRKCGGEGTSFDTIVASGLNSSMPHAIPGTKKLEKGDFVTMDFGCKYNGYCSDMTRTVVIGSANEKQKKIYDTVLNANLMALDFLKANVKGKDVDKIARDYIYANGYKGCFGHGLGHSVGLFIHESPRLSISEETVLVENMIETVEPGIYVPGFGGVRIEDLVVVKKEGYELLSHSPKKLIEL